MDEEYIIYNPTLGISDFVTVGEVETSSNETNAWLEDPYDMVGPFDLDELKSNGQISFAACFVMSRQRWKEERIFLQQEHFEDNKREHRELLCLPTEGKLEVSQIKAAYRKIIKKVHPDVGGSHEKFIEITKARDTLLEKLD
jgi:curved DNA-binding protein CbpA